MVSVNSNNKTRGLENISSPNLTQQQTLIATQTAIENERLAFMSNVYVQKQTIFKRDLDLMAKQDSWIA